MKTLALLPLVLVANVALAIVPKKPAPAPEQSDIAVKEPQEPIELQLERIATLLMEYRMLGGTYPTTEQGLQALIQHSKEEPVAKRWVQLLQEIPKDPWGRPLRYQLKDGKFSLWSSGPDLKDPNDDIRYPKPKKPKQDAPPKAQPK